jgi:hypothetical protein
MDSPVSTETAALTPAEGRGGRRGGERRRHPRAPLVVPVMLVIGDTALAGESANLSYSGVLVRGLPVLPATGSPCAVHLYVPAGETRGSGVVARVDVPGGTCGVEITRVEQGGQLLLAALLLNLETEG